MIKKILYIFLISMVPVVELRGAIPIGILASKLDWHLVFLLAVLGNMLPVPFILIFIKRILRWMSGVKHLDKIANFILKKAEKNTDKVQRFAFFGLVIFVGIPLPGTGAWTGSLVAAMLDMRLKYSIPAIFLGVIIAAVIMTVLSVLVSLGVSTAFDFLIPAV